MSPIVQHSSLAAKPGIYEAKALGAPFKVLLDGGVSQETDPKTGKVTTSIEDLPGLIAAVVKSRVFHPRKLSGDELKFIRSACAIKSSKMAEFLDVTPEHYSRCENGSKIMTSAAEKMYRLSIFLLMGTRDLGVAEVAQRLPAHERTKERAAEAYSDMKKLFFSLKIDPVFSANDDLCLTFHRTSIFDTSPCDDQEWEAKDKAA